MSNRKPFAGPCRKLVVGIDVGTTFSGVSYAILDPGVVPIIQGVNRYPAQERVGGDAKIPSVIYYDSAGFVRAVGAEALVESNVELAMDEQWIKVEWFKLHFRPLSATLPIDKHVRPMPPNKTIVQVLGDFLRYLCHCTRKYIQETHTNGQELWASLEGQADFVLTHPNGWGGQQQEAMRNAAIYGGLVLDTPDGHSRVHFVTEGEASLHYCIGNDFASDAIKSGKGVIIADAGGGTIDLSAYYMKEAPNEFEEIAPATCHFQGSVFVSRRAQVFLEKRLSKSRYGSLDDIAYITQCFDKSTKLGFKDPTQPSYIRFGSSRDTELSVGIKLGQLKLQGLDVAIFFEPSITLMRQAIREQKDAALIPVTSVLLVGGFAASDWVFSNLQTYLGSIGLHLSRPDGHLAKAVAEGAVSFRLDHFVSVRVARTTFGVKTRTPFVPTNPEHQRRSNTILTAKNGLKYLPNNYTVLLKRGTRVSETTIFRRPFSFKVIDLKSVTVHILAYRGQKQDVWIDEDAHMFSVACKVVADVRSLAQTLPPLTAINGKQYFNLEFEIELLFGLTEHKARIGWKENGEEKWSPAKIVYDAGVGRD